MAIEIVDLPSYKMVIFHSYVNVYQRVLGWQLDALGPCWGPVGTLSSQGNIEEALPLLRAAGDKRQLHLHPAGLHLTYHRIKNSVRPVCQMFCVPSGKLT